MQKDYDIKTPLRDITEQRYGSNKFFEYTISVTSPAKHTFRERTRIAKAFFYNKFIFEFENGLDQRLKMINNIISFYILQERVVPRVSLKRKSSMKPLIN